MAQMIIRFVVGGTIVSLFAVLGDITYPKGFAGLFAAAPSVALATLSLTAVIEGAGYAAAEARSMIAGEVALCAYAAACMYCLGARHARAAPTSLLLLALWGAVAAALYAWVLT
jgi:Protein of unknown function (DUF3147)